MAAQQSQPNRPPVNAIDSRKQKPHARIIEHGSFFGYRGIDFILTATGILIPKALLEQWGVGEGDEVELSADGIRPRRPAGLSHQALDELKRAIALAVVRRFTPREIRAQILANLHRWRQQGVTVFGKRSNCMVCAVADNRRMRSQVRAAFEDTQLPIRRSARGVPTPEVQCAVFEND